ncbi:hypothetical protein P22_2205 [Propionispora sp. 2/2-37]|uniref:DUF6115 domain-containing protein n=1 Tax=Propionispora sp. 2/2-37 TaxID=1677858 RepID=UPI0006C688CC|nr:hypothetical protein [Propionispora sp. 2/2-37]CUH96117.1 hypothetical protein P22_2205 [Propionispora sp. 2/2-37]
MKILCVDIPLTLGPDGVRDYIHGYFTVRGESMTGSTVVTIAALLFFVFFVFYKRELLLRLFSINAQKPANEFQERLEQTADDVIQRLEEKIIYLHSLLQEADRKIALLEMKLREEEPAEDTVLSEQKLSVMPIKKVAALYQQQSKTAEPQKAVDELEKEDSPLTGETDGFGKEHIFHQDKHRVVVAMAEQGYDVTEIAKAVGMGKGEIMLVLQLNKK